MQRRILLCLAVSLLAPASAAADDDDVAKAPLPSGWTQVRTEEVPAANFAPIAEKFGVEIDRLTNRFVSLNGFSARMNVITCATEVDAKKLLRKLDEMRKGFVSRKEKQVVEVPGTNLLVAKRVFAAFALPQDDKAEWEFVADIGCVDALDYMETNLVFNHFLKYDPDGLDDPHAKQIREMTKDWRFGTTTRLFTSEPLWFESAFDFEPASTGTKRRGAFTTYGFEAPPTRLDVPYVKVIARTTVQSRFEPFPRATDPHDTAATDYWPAKDPELKVLAASLTRGVTDERGKVQSFLRFLSMKIRYDGPMGSRHGVKKVLQQGFGRCWDKSDVLITLCRAAGIPARQVAGWVPPLNAGHVWAEVRVGDRGWIPVDATCTWLGTSADYIPLYATSDGAMPILYLSMPRVRKR